MRTAVGVDRIGSTRVSDEEHPFDPVTVTPRVTLPDAPAMNVTWCVPAPAVIVPFVIVQLYVAPTPTSGVEAVFPDAPGHIWVADGVMRAPGAGFTTMSAMPEDVPAHPVTSLTNVTE